MGRPSSNSGSLSDCLRLDVRRLKREGRLRPGWRFPMNWSRGGKPSGSIVLYPERGAAILRYRVRARGEEWRDVEERIDIVETACHYGGTRPWWVCPGCGERAAILYLWDGRSRCRRCRGLLYATQHEDARDRLIRRLRNLRLRLGGTANLLGPMPPKPKGMQWRTYLRLQGELIRLTEAYVAALGAFVGQMKTRSQRMVEAARNALGR